MLIKTENGIIDLEKEIELLKSKAIDKINYECDLLHNDFYNDEGLTPREIENKRTNNINSLIVEKGKNENGFYIFVYSEDMEEYGVEENYGKVTTYGETIEELCDEFVLVAEDYDYFQTSRKVHRRWVFDDLADTEQKEDEIGKGISRTIYGAIWTDEGLIFVAKMNEKGELELL